MKPLRMNRLARLALLCLPLALAACGVTRPPAEPSKAGRRTSPPTRITNS